MIATLLMVPIALCILFVMAIQDQLNNVPVAIKVPDNMTASTYHTIAYNASRILDLVHLNPTKDNALVQRYLNVTVHVQNTYIPSYIAQVTVGLVLISIMYVVFTSKQNHDGHEPQPMLP